MRVWVSSKEAKEIRRWAAEAGWLELADRFYRAERIGDHFGKPPFLWRWRARRPVLLKCLYCERWQAYDSHRKAKKHGWVQYAGRVWGSAYDSGGWIHEGCIEGWEAHAAEVMAARHEARKRHDARDFFFGRPDIVETYKGVLVRGALPQEHTLYGLLDELEATISAESGMERVARVIDEMPSGFRTNLVAAGFLGFHQRYGVVLGWAESVPPEYDGTKFGDVLCTSVVVEDVPKRFRDELPASLKARL